MLPMKGCPTILALSGVILLSLSCTEKKMPDDLIREVKSLVYISDDGFRHEFKVDDGDGQITSEVWGKTKSTEVLSLALMITKESYVIITDSATYYIPQSYALEVYN